MPRIEIIPLLSDNYAYAVTSPRTGLTAIVDPGEAQPIVEFCEKRNIAPAAIWCTHHHGDHVGGVAAIKEKYRAQVYGPADRRVPDVDIALAHKQSFAWGDFRVEVLHTPGHTTDALVYLIGDAAFTGDTLFLAGCGRLFECPADVMFHSLHAVLAPRMTAQTQIYCGHEYALKNLEFCAAVDPENERVAQRISAVKAARGKEMPSVPATWDDELATNSFLRVVDNGFRARLAKRFPDQQWTTPLEAFASLRTLRNTF